MTGEVHARHKCTGTYNHVIIGEVYAQHTCTCTVTWWQVNFMHNTPVQVHSCDDRWISCTAHMNRYNHVITDEVHTQHTCTGTYNHVMSGEIYAQHTCTGTLKWWQVKFMHSTPGHHVMTGEIHAQHTCTGTIMWWQVRFMHSSPAQVQSCGDRWDSCTAHLYRYNRVMTGEVHAQHTCTGTVVWWQVKFMQSTPAQMYRPMNPCNYANRWSLCLAGNIIQYNTTLLSLCREICRLPNVITVEVHAQHTCTGTCSHVMTGEVHAQHTCTGTVMWWQVKFMHSTPVQVHATMWWQVKFMPSTPLNVHATMWRQVMFMHSTPVQVHATMWWQMWSSCTPHMYNYDRIIKGEAVHTTPLQVQSCNNRWCSCMPTTPVHTCTTMWWQVKLMHSTPVQVRSCDKRRRSRTSHLYTYDHAIIAR